MRTADLGCGSRKSAGAVGVDRHPYPGVDVVCDLNTGGWPLEDASFDRVIASHVIEHVADPVLFMREIHRILKPGGSLVVLTPHFSSTDSWSDVTHLRHLSSRWHESFLPGSYLAEQAGTFELVETEVTFGKSVGALVARLVIALRGLRRWERSWAFTCPALDVRTVLRKVE
jgi:SAM-dependent methyltransferase